MFDPKLTKKKKKKKLVGFDIEGATEGAGEEENSTKDKVAIQVVDPMPEDEETLDLENFGKKKKKKKKFNLDELDAALPATNEVHRIIIKTYSYFEIKKNILNSYFTLKEIYIYIFL